MINGYDNTTGRRCFARPVRLIAGLLLGFLTHTAVSAADLVVTQIAPMATADARDYASGVRLAFDQANAAVAPGSPRLLLETLDDRGDPDTSRGLATGALARHPLAIVGVRGTRNVETLLPLLDGAKTPLLAPVVDASGVAATRNPYVFHTRPTVTQESASIIDNLVRMGLRRIAVCYQADGFGPSGLDGAQAALRRHGLQALGVVDHDASARRLERAVRNLADLDAQAVVFVGQTAAAAGFVRTLRAAGSHAMVVMNSTVDPQALIAQLPREAATWLAVAQSVPNPRAGGGADPLVREFADLHSRQRPDTAPSRAGLEGYVAGRVIVAALEQVRQRAFGRMPTVADVLAALEQTPRFDLGGLQVSFNREATGGIAQVRVGMVNADGHFLN